MCNVRGNVLCSILLMVKQKYLTFGFKLCKKHNNFKICKYAD